MGYQTGPNIRHNGSRLKLLSWNLGETIKNLTDETLRDSSRTESFSVVTGDTISLYREWRWWNQTTDSQTVSNYVALDTLDYSIEIINASTGARLALIDSLGALRQSSAGSPPLYGTRPIMAAIKYVSRFYKVLSKSTRVEPEIA